MTWTLWIQMLGKHNRRRKTLVKRFNQRGKGANTTRRRTYYDEIAGAVGFCCFVHCLFLENTPDGIGPRRLSLPALLLGYITFFAPQQQLAYYRTMRLSFFRAFFKSLHRPSALGPASAFYDPPGQNYLLLKRANRGPQSVFKHMTLAIGQTAG